MLTSSRCKKLVTAATFIGFCESGDFRPPWACSDRSEPLPDIGVGKLKKIASIFLLGHPMS